MGILAEDDSSMRSGSSIDTLRGGSSCIRYGSGILSGSGIHSSSVHVAVVALVVVVVVVVLVEVL